MTQSTGTPLNELAEGAGRSCGGARPEVLSAFSSVAVLPKGLRPIDITKALGEHAAEAASRWHFDPGSGVALNWDGRVTTFASMKLAHKALRAHFRRALLMLTGSP